MLEQHINRHALSPSVFSTSRSFLPLSVRKLSSLSFISAPSPIFLGLQWFENLSVSTLNIKYKFQTLKLTQV